MVHLTHRLSYSEARQLRRYTCFQGAPAAWLLLLKLTQSVHLTHRLVYSKARQLQSYTYCEGTPAAWYTCCVVAFFQFTQMVHLTHRLFCSKARQLQRYTCCEDTLLRGTPAAWLLFLCYSNGKSYSSPVLFESETTATVHLLRACFY